MAEERVAHALCPYCYPDDPREYIAEGTPAKRWCGETVPLSHDPVSSSANFCTKCEEAEKCPECGARMTFLGVMPPERSCE